MLREPTEILGDVVEQAVRLVRADGVILDLLDPSTGNLHWALDSGVRDLFTDEERAKLWISVGVGATGTAVAEDRVVIAGGDLATQFPPSPESTEFYERTGFQLDDRRADHRRGRPARGHRGLLEAARRLHARPTRAWSARWPARPRSPSRTRGSSTSSAARRAELAQTAEAERTLREIAGRVSAMRDQDEILQSVIDAAARLLQASGVDDRPDRRAGHGRGLARPARSRRGRRPTSSCSTTSRSTPTSASPGWRSGPGPTAWTGEYLEDRRFEHTPDRDTFVRESAIHSVLAAPLIHRDEVFGVINAYSDRVDAFDDTDAGPAGRAGRPGRRRHRQRPADRGAGAVARRRSPGGPTRSGPCARSPPASRPSWTRPRSSSRSPRRPPACSSPTAPGSTSTTRRSTRCAGRTPPATRCRRCPSGPGPAASSPARRWPAWRSPSGARS